MARGEGEEVKHPNSAVNLHVTTWRQMVSDRAEVPVTLTRLRGSGLGTVDNF